jgi:hypothetical protein
VTAAEMTLAGGKGMHGRLDKGGRLRWRREEDTFTLYNYDTDDLFEVPEAAITILELADGQRRADEVVRAVTERHGDLSADEVEAYIQELAEAQLVKVV